MNTVAVIQNFPVFGRMFNIDKSTGLEEVNSWPGLMVLTSFVWLLIAGLLGVLMPATQIFQLDTNIFYSALTLHGAALSFPFLFQLMVGMSLHRAGSCLGKPATGILTQLIYWSLNIGALLLTIAVVVGGLKVSYAIMYPLPLVGVANGQWSMWAVQLGFTGIYLILASVIVFYPLKILSMTFLGEVREDLMLSKRDITDPGMVGMVMAVLILLVMGTPIMIVSTIVMLVLYGVLPMELVSWATEPAVFQFAFFIWAHNLMEAMAIMVISAIYGTLPLYLADGTRKLYSDRLANLALWILLLTSFTSFFHHFYTTFPALPAALAYHGNLMSWATGVGAALSIFTILATVWQHGVRPEPGVIALFAGFILYIFDGTSAIITSNIAWTFQLHGTMWQSGHTMNVLIAISLLWLGVLYHHYPVITGRKLDRSLGNKFVILYMIGGLGAGWAMLAGGADGMPRRFAAWNQEGWMLWGNLILVFGLILGLSLLILAYNFFTSRNIEATSEEQKAAGY